MKLLTLVVLFFPIILLSQNKLTKDLDGDAIMDTIYIDYEASKIICMLSADNFKTIKSKEIETLSEASGIKDAKNGFVFSNHWMRAGYDSQFRYNKKTKRIRLIGMDRYELGNAVHDGVGESSVNLLTNNYIGDWNYYDDDKNELIKIPTIKTKMCFSKIYLEDFNDTVYDDFYKKCSALYQ